MFEGWQEREEGRTYALESRVSCNSIRAAFTVREPEVRALILSSNSLLRKVSDSGIASSEPVDPEPVDPELVDPELVDPELVDPELVDPELVDPELVDSEPVESEPVEWE
jgi:hypothetical protein